MVVVLLENIRHVLKPHAFRIVYHKNDNQNKVFTRCQESFWEQRQSKLIFHHKDEYNTEKKEYCVHIASGQKYSILFKNVQMFEDPTTPTTIYAQTQSSFLHGTSLLLPAGTCWERDIVDFEAKFKILKN